MTVMRMLLLAFCGCLLTAPPFQAHAAKRERTERPPNIVMFYIDDLGWRDVGFMGSQFYETPHIDALARSGMIFTQAYANAPNCAPSRACLMSGMYSPRHGIYTVGTPERGKSVHRKLIPTPNTTTLRDDIVTIPEALKKAGYVSAQIGKWHLGSDPKQQGFTFNAGGTRAGSPPGGYFSPYKNKHLSPGPRGEYLTDRLTEEAVGFIERNADRPFFLYLSHYAVHTPIQPKEKLKQKYAAKKPVDQQDDPAYAAMVESVDHSVGRVMGLLEQRKLLENTLVLFYSDNGGHARFTSNAPLRGSKGRLYEGGIRVPLAISWPGKISAGSTCAAPVIGVDLYPTFLEAADLEAPADKMLDGVSLWPLLSGEQESLDREAIYWHFPAYLEAYLPRQGLWRTTPAGAIRRGDWKLLEFFEDGRLELYNLARDPGEENDLAQEEPQQREQLYQAMKAWRKATGAPVPTRRNPEYAPE